MSITEAILTKLQRLSAEDQQRILEAINKLPTTEKKDGLGSATGDAQLAKTSIWAKLQAMGEAFEDAPCELPADLAANHDFYLHGLPRRS